MAVFRHEWAIDRQVERRLDFFWSGKDRRPPPLLSPEQLDTLAHLPATCKTGHESFTAGGQPLATTLLDFWQWSVSDLVSNATRGRLAEFIVASALPVNCEVRNEWDAYDLKTTSGLRIEVKSCGYLQSLTRPRRVAPSHRVPTPSSSAGPGAGCRVPRVSPLRRGFYHQPQ